VPRGRERSNAGALEPLPGRLPGYRLDAGEIRRGGRHGIEVVAVREHDRLDRVGADKDDFHVPVFLVPIFHRLVRVNGLGRVRELPLEDELLELSVVDEKEVDDDMLGFSLRSKGGRAH
jgi:hypothetical protein